MLTQTQALPGGMVWPQHSLQKNIREKEKKKRTQHFTSS
jgi:hypothetical protein